MAPNLRSSSHARSNNSRPSTPLEATAPAAPVSAASSFTDSTRPRKQRRTGRHSRVATDTPQDTASRDQSQSDQFGTRAMDSGSESQAPETSLDWSEPPTRAPVPSYKDTPWSAVSSEANPILATMRPLGSMPSAAEKRKLGIVSVKPDTPNIPAKNGPQAATLNGEKGDDKPQTPLTPAEESAPEPVLPETKDGEDLTVFTTIPLPASTDFNVDKIKIAVENALSLASETENRPVIRGLIRLWKKCGQDPFALSILDGMCQENPGPREKSAFQTVMRAAWKEVRSEEDAEPELVPSPRMSRPRSASSVSSLSSAKSLDVETFAPEIAPRAANARARVKGKHARAIAQKAKGKENLGPSSRHSAPFVDASLQRKRALEESSEFSAEAVKVKRTRLQRNLPKIAPTESRLRSSLASNSPSTLSTPGPTPVSRSQGVISSGPVQPRRERSESPASSDAGDNKRLTPTLSSKDGRIDNNDFCRECRNSGQLLCCDGCPDSFHFSCLDPPLDPAEPPDGDWFCPKCEILRAQAEVNRIVEGSPEKDFNLSAGIRDFFAGVRTGDGGKYEEVVSLPRHNPRTVKGSRTGRYDDPYLMRLVDGKGNLITCHRCGRTSNGNRPIVQCDFCACAFHMDCVDPPLAIPPNQRAGSDRVHQNWMCPNHALHDMYYIAHDEEGYDAVKRIRRPRNPRYVDIEILPEDDESDNIEDQEEEGVMYRVSEKGVKLDFITRVKRENEEMAIKKAATEKYFKYAQTKHDEFHSKALEFYSSQKPAVAEEDTTTAILSARTVAEREAASNLIAFAQSNRISTQVEGGKISLLIDQLKANAPKNLPSAETEIASLRALQNLIEMRIKAVQSQSSEPASSNSPQRPIDVQSVDTEMAVESTDV